MRGLSTALLGGLCMIATAGLTQTARAQSSCGVTGLSTAQIPGQGLAATPVSNVQFLADANESVTFLARGNAVYSLYNKTTAAHVAGSPKIGYSPPEFPAPIAGGQPQLVDLGVTYQQSLITAAGGRVYRINANTGTIVWSFDARRPSCTTDLVQAIPMVVLKEYIPSLPDDLVVVSTRYTCSPGERTTNRVYAIGANPAGSTPIVYWTSASALPLDQGVGGTIDYVNRFIYYAFRQPYATQPSIVRFNVLNGSHLEGSVAQTFLAGDVTTIPQLRDGNRIFVGTYDATIRAFDLATRQQRLNFPIASSASTTLTQPFVLARGGGFDTMIVATTQDGFVRGLVVTPNDAALPNAATVPWPAFKPNGIAASAPVAIATKIGKIYVPRTDGKVTQVNATSALLEATAIVGTGSLPQPSLDVEGDLPSANRLLAAASGIGSTPGTTLIQLCIPWPYGAGGGTARAGEGSAPPQPLGGDPPKDPPPKDPPPEDPAACRTVEDCDPALFGGRGGPGEVRQAICHDGGCGSIPANEGKPCVDGCLEGISAAGVCVSTGALAPACQCNLQQKLGGLGCVPTEYCTGPIGDGCVNLKTSNSHCGSVGNACDITRDYKCTDGKCQRFSCDSYPTKEEMTTAVVQGKLSTSTSVVVSWKRAKSAGLPNECSYVLGNTGGNGISVYEGNIASISHNAAVKIWGNPVRLNPVTSVAVTPGVEAVFSTFAETAATGNRGGLEYTITDRLKHIDSPTAGNTASLPFIPQPLDSGPLGIAIQNTSNGKDLIVYVGNMDKLGDVKWAVATAVGSDYSLGPLNSLLTTPSGHRVISLSYGPRIPATATTEAIDGRLWITYQLNDTTTAISAYCDAILNEGQACNSPGFKNVVLPAGSKVQPGYVKYDTGDYIFTQSDLDGYFRVKVVAGQDFEVLDGNKVNESIGLPVLPPTTQAFVVTALNNFGMQMFMPGTTYWGTIEMFRAFSARQ